MYANISNKRSNSACSIRGHNINDEEPSDGDLLQYNLSLDEYNHKNISEIHHNTQHENDGVDEINVNGLSGLLDEPQIPVIHSSRHEKNGDDEINVTGLSGLLNDLQKAGYINNISISSSPPTNGQVLGYNLNNDCYEPIDVTMGDIDGGSA